MSEEGRGVRRFWLGLALGVTGGVVAGRWLIHGQPMVHLRVWRRELARQGRSPEEAARIAARVQARYAELLAAGPRLDHRLLRLHLRALVLPGLALYETLLEELGDRQAALAETERLFGATFGRFRPLLSWLEHFPGDFSLFRSITRRVIEIGFPPAGWEIEAVEDSEECIAFDYTRCFYLDMLCSYDASELAPLFCRMDDMLYEALPAEISWQRTQTLAEGADRCDFRWCWQPDPSASGPETDVGA